MHAWLRGTVALGMVLATSGVAQAGKLMTPPVARSGNLDQRVTCMLANSKSKAVGPVSLTIYGTDGAVILTQDFASVDPKAIAFLIATDNDLGNVLYTTCEADGKGISKKTPITMCVSSAATSDCQAAASAP